MKKAIIIFVLALCAAIVFLLDPFAEKTETTSVVPSSEMAVQ